MPALAPTTSDQPSGFYRRGREHKQIVAGLTAQGVTVVF